MFEETVAGQPYVPYPAYRMRTKEDALRELTAPCDRFRTMFSTREQINLFLARELDQRDMLANVTNVMAPGMPLNWRALLKYLNGHGIVTKPHFSFMNRLNDFPKTYGAELRSRPIREGTDGHIAVMHSFGNSNSAEKAMAKSVGEILERYFLRIYKRASFRRASQKELLQERARNMDIAALNSFLPWQIQKNPRFGRDEHSYFYWVRGETIGGEDAYIPAQIVFWGYDFSFDKDEPMLSHATTNGAAGHFTKEEAILSGILENVERDGFLIYWLNGISPRIVDPSDTNDDELQTILADTERYGLKAKFLDTTTDVGIPTVTCALIDDRGETPEVIVSAASGFTTTNTLLKSVREALNIMQLRGRREDFSLPEEYAPFTDSSVGQRQRIALWKGKKMMERFSFFISGERESPEDFLRGTPQGLSAIAQLNYVLGKLHALGPEYEPYIYEARHEVLKTLGYHVVQTIVPPLIPMYLKENLATLDSKRLREVPEKLGFKAAETLNPWPHPFP